MTRQKLSHIFTKIVLKALHTNLFHIVLLSIFLTLGNFEIQAQENRSKSIPIPAAKQKDSVNIGLKDIVKPADTVKNDTIKKKKSLLEGIVKRKAKKYEKIDQKKKELTLYDEAELIYKDIELKAGIIVFNYEKDEVYAGRIKDSLGNYIQIPVFKQGQNVIEPDSIRFNTKTKKALVWNSRTQQGEFKVKAEVSKRENDSVYFMRNARFTTSENIEDPEYYFLARKIKFVPKKKVVTGFTNMVIADVPTPIALPFAYFPMSEKAVSGFVIPTFGDSAQKGYFFQNGGYYFALSDYYDLQVLGDYYTNGSYAFRLESAYAKRYNFNGRVNFRFENQINSEKGFPDYARSKQYNIQWFHSQDAKANPNSRFSASVNLGSSQYFRQSLNQTNIGSSLNNNLSSSVSYQKTFQTVPMVNFSVTANHSQNTNTEEIDMTLPTVQASVDRIFPFAPKNGIKKGFIKNINFQYNFRGENRIHTTDSLFFKPGMFDTAKNGIQHTIPISTNFKVFKYFSVTAATNYNEVWYFKTIEKEFNPNTNTVETNPVNGFDAYRTYDFRTQVGTTIYGTFNFGNDKKIQSIRHVMYPSISYSYLPSFNQYYDTYALDNTGTRYAEYTRFQEGIFGGPSNSKANRIGMSLNNNFEAKVRDKDETKTEPKKVMLLSNLTFSTDYNIAADSLAWSPLSVNGGTQFFDNKLNLNFGTSLDPYAVDNSGRRIDKFNIDNGGSLFRMTTANMTINYAISSADGKTKGDSSQQTVLNGGRTDDLFGRGTDLSDNRQSLFKKEDEKNKENDDSEFYKLEIPWNLTMAYSLTYSNVNRENEIIGNSLMMSGNIDLTPKWKMGFSSGYDFVQKGVTFTQLRFERDLLSWRMSFNWVPIAPNTSWGFFIGIKSSVLSDIKYDKRSLPDRTLQ
ncbi:MULTISPECIES: putative LPS assembly protein LptD [Flavobacterium]|uniref:putative LPS assembly protein LptD n=1 Tax=Flavobacterium TaxID=237 RepID=UPI001FCB6D36|nr:MULTISPECIES: putative LPS assembly protein LptD [Flavobacterium]UOK41661.1 LPS-assembly protein LptD [Flavobacterium enshiense]